MENVTFSPLPEALPSEEIQHVVGLKLEPYQKVVFSGNHPYADEKMVENIAGLKEMDLVAMIKVDEENIFYVLRAISKKEGFNTPYVLADDEFMENPYEHEATHFKGMRIGEVLTVGRNHLQDLFDHSGTVARNQFQLEATEEGVVLKNLIPTNPTLVYGNIVTKRPTNKLPKHEYLAEYTSSLEIQRDSGRVHFGPIAAEAINGFFRHRAIIGRNSKTLRDGVYHTRGSEGLVVDDKNSITKGAVQSIIYKAEFLGEDAPTDEILQIVEAQVRKILRYDLDKVDEMSELYYPNNDSIGISEYIKEGVGVCRHQAILAALTMEEMITQGILTGTAGVERSLRKNLDTGEVGGHAWAVYRPADRRDENDDIIIDPAKECVVLREDSKRLNGWRYILDEDQP